ncbi:MAG: T9SS type A sorting domain-containing protein, partial [Calditrichaeota bacterium]|nr:T9SS type A sorting domain-containing protein [Calditrichota bacterium]
WRGLRIPNETSIGFAYSLDGGITWRKRNNPVLEADLELVRGGEVTDVAVIHINDLYLMVISSHGGETNGYKEGYIWRALSVDGINWEMLPERIINNLEGWYNMPICNSQLSLYYDENDDEVHLAFAAVDYRFEGAGIAVASTNDLENWVVHDNPLIRSTGNPDQFDGGAVFSPDITCQDGRYTLLYGGINEREWFDYIARHIGRVGLMTSENGQDFMRYQGFGTGSSILEPEENGDWEERFIYGGRLFEWEGQQRILYCAYRAHEENLYHSPAFGLALGASVQPPLFAPPFSEDNNSSPGAFQLDPAFPNPFNSMTTISYGLQHHGQISLQVYNPLGQKINTLFEGYSKAGVYSSSLVADNLPSGLYFIQLETSGQVFTQKVMLIR